MDALKQEDGESLNIVEENIEALKAIFPDAFTEDGIDFEALRQLLGNQIADGEEKYGLTWHGKKKARQIALTPSTGTLRPCPEESVDWDTTQNLFIEGDNLEVLKLLQKSYAGKVKMIYIDPPYNTGNDFVYKDDFRNGTKHYLENTDQLGKTSNPESSGRYHTDWLNMIYVRLKVARSLLEESGILFMSIDDNECQNLQLVANEIFGEECFAGKVTVLCNPKGRSQDKFLATCHEYLLIYSKSPLEKGDLNVPKSSDDIQSDYPFEDEGGVYRELELRNTHREFGKFNRPNLFYPFYYSKDGQLSLENTHNAVEILPLWPDGFEGCWTWGKEKAKESSANLVAKKVNGQWKVYRKAYASDDGGVPTKQLKSIWSEKRHHTEKGQKAFNELFDTKGKIFQSPKSLDLILDCIDMCQSDDMIVMDFFAGSGTSSHAVLASNVRDNANRRFIAVQIPEVVEPTSEAGKNGFETISQISMERIRRAAKAMRVESPNSHGDLGFKVFKLDSSNIRAWNPDATNLEQSLLDHAEHLVEGRSEQDILYELLLKRGVDLTVPIEEKKIAGKTVYSIGFGVLFACLDDKIGKDEIEPLAQGIAAWHKELEPASDTQVVFRDSAFADDIAKTNMTAILEQNGIANVRSL